MIERVCSNSLTFSYALTFLCSDFIISWQWIHRAMKTYFFVALSLLCLFLLICFSFFLFVWKGSGVLYMMSLAVASGNLNFLEVWINHMHTYALIRLHFAHAHITKHHLKGVQSLRVSHEKATTHCKLWFCLVLCTLIHTRTPHVLIRLLLI